MRPFIVLGDATDHGGIVIGASAMTDTHGKRIARVGDQVTCPKKGHGTTVIVTGDSTMIVDGKAVARHGDRCACGATLIASQVVSGMHDDREAFSYAETRASAPAGVLSRFLPKQQIETHDLRFLVKDEVTGRPLAQMPYRMKLSDGLSIEGATDDHGFTEKIASNAAKMASIEVPYYGDCSSPTYTHFGHDTCGC